MGDPVSRYGRLTVTDPLAHHNRLASGVSRRAKQSPQKCFFPKLQDKASLGLSRRILKYRDPSRLMGFQAWVNSNGCRDDDSLWGLAGGELRSARRDVHALCTRILSLVAHGLHPVEAALAQSFWLTGTIRWPSGIWRSTIRTWQRWQATDFWRGWRGSNPRPLASEANTLSTELQPHWAHYRTRMSTLRCAESSLKGPGL